MDGALASSLWLKPELCVTGDHLTGAIEAVCRALCHGDQVGVGDTHYFTTFGNAG